MFDASINSALKLDPVCLSKLHTALINNDLPNFQQIPLCLLGQRRVEHQASMRKVIKIFAPSIAMQPL